MLWNVSVVGRSWSPRWRVEESVFKFFTAVRISSLTPVSSAWCRRSRWLRWRHQLPPSRSTFCNPTLVNFPHYFILIVLAWMQHYFSRALRTLQKVVNCLRWYLFRVFTEHFTLKVNSHVINPEACLLIEKRAAWASARSTTGWSCDTCCCETGQNVAAGFS